MSDRGHTNRKVLMVAYFFPPVGGAGSLRPLKLAKYLPDYGWDPVVLTVKNPDWYYAADPALLSELPDSVSVFRAKMIRSSWIYRLLNPIRASRADRWIRRFLLHPDEQIGWIPAAYAAGLRIVRRHSIKAIYSTSAPMSCHLIAYLIKKKTGLPWIADFRDEWYENPDFDFPTLFHRRLHYHLEKTIVNTAHKVIAPAPEFCRLLAKHCSSSNKFMTITMGFDPEDFSKHSASRTDIGKEGKFELAFSGLFYGSFRPSNLLKALNELIDERKISSDKIKLRFVGANNPDEIDFKDRYSICEFTGFVSHKKAIQYLTDADALLLLLSKERGKNVIPSKTFEYIASGKPILAMVPSKGNVAEIIRKTKTGIVVDFDDLEGTKHACLRLYEQWQAKTNHMEPNFEQVAKYDQRDLTKNISQLLDRITMNCQVTQ